MPMAPDEMRPCLAVQQARAARKVVPEVADQVDAVIDCCAQAPLGMSYAEHVASLTVDSAVSWTTHDYYEIFPEGRKSTIATTVVGSDLGILGVHMTVWAPGNRGTVQFNPSTLRLA